MNARSKLTLVCALLIAIGAGGAAWSTGETDPIVEHLSMTEVLYIPSARTVKAMSLGYTGLMADIYWTRVVQYFGNKHLQSAESYKLLAPLLDTTVTLDPQLDIAYQFGAFFLAQKPPEGAGDPDAAIALVRRGIEANPGNWRLYNNLGFVYWMEKKDPVAAAKAFEDGSKIPGAMLWMKVLAGAMAQHASDLGTAKLMWTEVLKHSGDGAIRVNAERRLLCIESDERVLALQQRVDFFRRQTGKIPTFRDLIGVGLLAGEPVDPLGNPYLVNREGRVTVSSMRELPFITQGVPDNAAQSDAPVPELSR